MINGFRFRIRIFLTMYRRPYQISTVESQVDFFKSTMSDFLQFCFLRMFTIETYSLTIDVKI